MSGNPSNQQPTQLDCSRSFPDVTPYPDISGIGVVVGYAATGFIVVSILTFYYVLAFQHDLDPFRKKDETVGGGQAASFRPNPIDSLVYGALKKIHLRKPNSTQISHRLNTSLIKCVLSMSDIQIVNGISILISGYVSIGSLSIYHWQVLVYLAWFSSLTHFCCLTFLRNYLYNHPGQRLWRISSMFLIIIMLLVAIFPTGSFEWVDMDGNPSPGSPAVCFFGKEVHTDLSSFDSMIISILLLALGFTSRTVRLYKTLSLNVAEAARKFLSLHARNTLQKLHTTTVTRMYIYPYYMRSNS